MVAILSKDAGLMSCQSCRHHTTGDGAGGVEVVDPAFTGERVGRANRRIIDAGSLTGEELTVLLAAI